MKHTCQEESELFERDCVLHDETDIPVKDDIVAENEPGEIKV